MKVSSSWRHMDRLAVGDNLAGAVFAVGSALMPLLADYLVVEGSAVVETVDGKALELNSGDVVIFPNGDAYHMSSRGATRPFPDYGIRDKITARDLSPLHAGGGGETSHFVCGYMTCDPHISRAHTERPATCV